MQKRLDLVGKKFGKLRVTRFSHSDGNSYWRAKCDCGNWTTVKGAGLVSGNIRSCGCIYSESNRNKGGNLKHDRSGTPEYKIWGAMKGKCNNPNHRNYQTYGAKGIKVCPEWKSDFLAFLEHVGEQPSGHTLVRIDNKKDFCPGNVKWVPKKTRNSSIMELSKELNIPYEYIHKNMSRSE